MPISLTSVLRETLSNYLLEKANPFTGNWLADAIRNAHTDYLRTILGNDSRYVVKGSAGQGRWAEIPWIAIMDRFITSTAQSGYYLVYLFSADMSRVYLSLNQGVTAINSLNGESRFDILLNKAQLYRSHIQLAPSDSTKIKLKGNWDYSALYECGNIISCEYLPERMPSSHQLINDLKRFMGYYHQLILNAPLELTPDDNLSIETKSKKLHLSIARNSSLSNRVKSKKGYRCEVCSIKFDEVYGDIGRGFIEAHHLTPVKDLDIGETRVDLEKDFAVLCANCHRMIHKLEDPSDVEGLKQIWEFNNKG
ncbi:MAG: DUF3578 domain-containing protein [Bacteroidia bacterium]|nr:DUF3578 domain-containing protein [Bacteroidia bacterium]